MSAITVVDLDPENKRVIFPQCDIPVQCKNAQPAVKIFIFFYTNCVQRTLICVAVVFTFRFKFTLHYSLHVAAALLYLSFQDADFFCRDVVQHNLLVTVFLSRSLAQLKLKMTSVFLILTLKKKKLPASTVVARTYFLSSTTEIPGFLDVLGVSKVMTDIWEPKKRPLLIQKPGGTAT